MPITSSKFQVHWFLRNNYWFVRWFRVALPFTILVYIFWKGKGLWPYDFYLVVLSDVRVLLWLVVDLCSGRVLSSSILAVHPLKVLATEYHLTRCLLALHIFIREETWTEEEFRIALSLLLWYAELKGERTRLLSYLLASCGCLAMIFLTYLTVDLLSRKKSTNNWPKKCSG